MADERYERYEEFVQTFLNELARDHAERRYEILDDFQRDGVEGYLMQMVTDGYLEMHSVEADGTIELRVTLAGQAKAR